MTSLALVLSWLQGLACVVLLWPRERSLRADVPVLLPLGLGIGLGTSSVFFFSASLISPNPWLLATALELQLLAGSLPLIAARLRNLPPAPLASIPSGSGRDPIAPMSAFLLVQAGVLALFLTRRAFLAEPFSNSDGWTIWNMHARIIFRGGTEWPALLRSPLLAWTHPDYPLLVPASVARVWAWVGTDAPAAAGTVSTLFGLATAGLLVGALLRLRHPALACSAGLVLLGTPFFVTFSSNQHADIPLAFHVLALAVVVALPGRTPGAPVPWALAGGIGGLAAWTKNEGALLALAAAGLGFALCGRRGQRRHLLPLLGGLAFALIPVAYFKAALAPANDLVGSQPWHRWALAFDGARHQVLLASLWRDLWRFGEWAVAPFLPLALLLVGPGWRRLARSEWLAGLLPLFLLGGYYLVYLVTPYELSSHIDSSLVRLLLQLWPAALFGWGLVVTYPSAAHPSVTPGPATTARPARSRVFLAHAVAATVMLVLLARQPAANELALARPAGERVRILLSEGWYGRETHGSDVWAWSRGTATLLLQSEANAPVTTTLSLSLRSLGPCTVTARLGERELWRGAVGLEAASVVIPRLTLAPGATALVFQTDMPGVPEAPLPGARTLTYALYNPALD